jgi:hypothetical protein
MSQGTDRRGHIVTSEQSARQQASPAEETEHRTAAQVRKLERMQDALRVRDQFLLEMQSELRKCMDAMRVHIETVHAVAPTLDASSAEVVKAKATLLSFSLDRATAALAQVVELARLATERLSSPDLASGPALPPVPETD